MATLVTSFFEEPARARLVDVKVAAESMQVDGEAVAQAPMLQQEQTQEQEGLCEASPAPTAPGSEVKVTQAESQARLRNARRGQSRWEARSCQSRGFPPPAQEPSAAAQTRSRTPAAVLALSDPAVCPGWRQENQPVDGGAARCAAGQLRSLPTPQRRAAQGAGRLAGPGKRHRQQLV